MKWNLSAALCAAFVGYALMTFEFRELLIPQSAYDLVLMGFWVLVPAVAALLLAKFGGAKGTPKLFWWGAGTLFVTWVALYLPLPSILVLLMILAYWSGAGMIGICLAAWAPWRHLHLFGAKPAH